MEKLYKSLCIYVAYLRALYFLHQQHHWTAAGDAYFAKHKMFEMLYESAAEDADSAAEKFVGMFGDECLDFKTQIDCMNQILSSLTQDDHVERSLTLEEEFLEYSKKLYKVLKNEHPEELTMGLDDCLMNIANHRESACYHLKRTLKN